MAEEKWVETGKLDGYPESVFLTGLGNGSTLSEAQKDAARNLSNQIDSDIRSKYEKTTSRHNLSISRSTRDNLSIKTHAKLYGLINIRGKFVKNQGSYVALVGVRRKELVRYLRGRMQSLEQTISLLQEDLAQASNPMRRVHDLSGIVRAKEKAAFYDREVAAISGGAPTDQFNSQKEISQIETILSREMTVSVSVVNACGLINPFARHVRESIEQSVNQMGLLVVPSEGKIRINGHVSATPMGPDFSRSYLFYVLHYSLSMSAPDGTIWGSVVGQQKVAGLNPGQAEMLASQTVSKEGVGPLLNGLKSRLFFDENDPRYVAFPSVAPGQVPAEIPVPPEGQGCRDFGE